MGGERRREERACSSPDQTPLRNTSFQGRKNNLCVFATKLHQRTLFKQEVVNGGAKDRECFLFQIESITQSCSTRVSCTGEPESLPLIITLFSLE